MSEATTQTNPTQPKAPLSGITVIEVGVFLAAPFGTAVLADLGARVIKVEAPGGGDPVRATGPFVGDQSSNFIRVNRNKESIVLDLKSEVGRADLKKLLGQADVLVENLRPGAMKRLGLGYEDLRGEYPRLVYASASGWGQTGPLAANPGLDIMAQARSGLMSITGHPDSPPAKVGVPVCDMVTAIYLALGIVSALFERTASGQGQYVDVSLHESAVSLAVWEAGAYFGNGSVGKPNGSAHQTIAPYQAVKTSDGFVTIGPSTQGLWERFCGCFDFEPLARDERFSTPALRMENRESLIREIEQRTLNISSDAVVDALTAAGVPVAPIYTYDQVFHDDHLVARDFFWKAHDGELGDIDMVGSAMHFSRSQVVRGNPGPRLGQHGELLVREFGLSGSGPAGAGREPVPETPRNTVKGGSHA